MNTISYFASKQPHSQVFIFIYKLDLLQNIVQFYVLILLKKVYNQKFYLISKIQQIIIKKQLKEKAYLIIFINKYKIQGLRIKEKEDTIDNYLSHLADYKFRLYNKLLQQDIKSLHPAQQLYYIPINKPIKEPLTPAQYKYILQDIKSQMQQIPSLQSLLKLTEKTTKKLQCLNLYSQTEKREFDLQLEEQYIYNEMNILYKNITEKCFQQSKEQINEENTQGIYTQIDSIKQKYIKTFDLLTKQQEILSKQLYFIDKVVEEDQKKEQTMNQIKQLDQYDDEQFQQYNDANDQANEANNYNYLFENPQIRIDKLKIEIDEIQKKISKINSGKGKWFDTDHKDFIKIYNRCGGNDKKIIAEGIKMLGMKQTEIMDHLQLYEGYLQLQKQKKLASEEYKQIKFIKEEQKRQQEAQKQQLKKLEEKVHKQKQFQDRLRKKQKIQLFRHKKAEQKQKMIQKQQEEKQSKLKVPPLQPSKKKQIMERNRIFLQNQNKKIQQVKIKKQSMQNPKRLASSNKIKTIENSGKIIGSTKVIFPSNTTGNKFTQQNSEKKE